MTATVPDTNLLGDSTTIVSAIVEPTADANSFVKRDDAVLVELTLVEKAVRVFSQNLKRGVNLFWGLTLVVLILAMYYKNVGLEKNLTKAAG